MPPQTADEKVLQRRVADAVKAVSATGSPKYLGFFNEREVALATAEMNRHRECASHFYGGYEGAERVMLCVFEDGSEADVAAFPIAVVRVEVAGGTPTHRDYLGALLGLGLERVLLGDVVPDETGALVYLQRPVMPLVCQELTGVGRFGAEAKEVQAAAPVAAEATGQKCTASVSSLRLDAVLAAMLHASRNDAAATIKRGLVQVNHLPVDTTHYTVVEGDTFSIRGVGKFRLQALGGKSRKNRVFIEYIQY